MAMDIKKDNLGFEYYESPPRGYVIVTSPAELFVLKQGKRKFIKDNVEVACGSTLLVFSEYTGRYYIRKVHDATNPYEQTTLMSLVKQRKLHILYDLDNKAKISQQFNQCGLQYYSMVKHNELTYEFDELVLTQKYNPGFESKKRMIEQELIKYSNNKRK